MAEPAYQLKDLVDACKEGVTGIYIPGNVQTDARNDFGLYTKQDIVNFVADEGFEDLKHHKVDDWNNNPKPLEHEIKIDVYYFYSGDVYGYFAFMDNTITKKWHIKSFKKNQRVGPKQLEKAVNPLTSKMFKIDDMDKLMKLIDKGDQNDE